MVKMIKLSHVKSLAVDLTIAALMLFPTLAHGAVRNVPAAYGTIQAAIDAAAPGDQVVIADGTYSGGGNVDLDFKGKAILVRSANGPQAVVIDAGGTPDANHRGFYFHSAETGTSILKGVTIQNGYLSGQEYGGGIRIANASPTIVDCVITGNTALEGAGVNVGGAGSSPIFRNVTISANGPPPGITDQVNNQGGGGMRIVDRATVTVIDSRIDGNTSAGSGGGILVDHAVLNIIGATISNNQTTKYNGGGIAVVGPPDGLYAAASIVNCRIFGNTASLKGGALRFNQVDPDNTLQVVNTLIYGNTSGAGDGTTLPEGSDPRGNGAAVDAWQASPALINCTITGNTETDGYAILHAHTIGEPASGHPANITLVNGIIYANDTSGPLVDAQDEGASVQISYSLVDDATFAGNNNITDRAPLFADADTDDYHLSSSSPNISPAIDAGNNAALPNDSLDLNHDGNTDETIPIDLDGAPRLYDQTDIGTAIVDMGAYEVSPPVWNLDSNVYAVSEGGGPLRFTIRLVGSGEGAPSVTYATSDGTAVAGSDYTAVSGTITWSPGEPTSQTIEVPIADNADQDGDRTFTIALSDPTGGSMLGYQPTGTATIVDDDTVYVTPGGSDSSVGDDGGGGCFISALSY